MNGRWTAAQWNSKISGAMFAFAFMSPRRSAFRFLVSAALLSLLPLLASAQKGVENLDGSPADPFSSSPGKPIVLLFVRTDCPISNRYAPLINQLSSEYAAKVSFWLVYPARSATPEKIRQHERDFGYRLPALRDPQHILAAQAQVQITPEAAVFDSNHRLLYHGRIDNLYQDFGRARAAASTHELAEAIQAALTGKKPPANAPAIGCFIADLE